MHVHGPEDQHVSKGIREHGIWEAYESRLVVERLKQGQTFLDVGANIGYYTVLAGMCVGQQGQVLSFEPERENFALLQANIALNCLENVKPVQAALAAQQGEGTIYLNTSNYGDHQIYDDASGRKAYPVRLLNGAEYLDSGESGISCDRVDFIKVDTQGAEYGVLRGLTPLIEASLPELTMIVEFWPAGLNRASAVESEAESKPEPSSQAHALLDILVGLDLDMFVIDHINHGLIPCVEKDIRDWIIEVEANPENEGFINMLLAPKSQRSLVVSPINAADEKGEEQ
jgi:FkbM family methyltransferase